MISDELAQPDLRTLQGALDFIGRGAINFINPEKFDTEANRSRLNKISEEFSQLLTNCWESIPEGPGRTRFIHAVNRAKQEAMSVILNGGA